jgi:hypothetical protein
VGRDARDAGRSVGTPHQHRRRQRSSGRSTLRPPGRPASYVQGTKLKAKTLTERLEVARQGCFDQQRPVATKAGERFARAAEALLAGDTELYELWLKRRGHGRYTEGAATPEETTKRWRRPRSNYSGST